MAKGYLLPPGFCAPVLVAAKCLAARGVRAWRRRLHGHGAYEKPHARACVSSFGVRLIVLSGLAPFGLSYYDLVRSYGSVLQLGLEDVDALLCRCCDAAALRLAAVE